MIVGRQKPYGECARHSCDERYDRVTKPFGTYCSNDCRMISQAVLACPPPGPSVMFRLSDAGLDEARAADLGWLDCRVDHP
jgi:hypothetical protein